MEFSSKVYNNIKDINLKNRYKKVLDLLDKYEFKKFADDVELNKKDDIEVITLFGISFCSEPATIMVSNKNLAIHKMIFKTAFYYKDFENFEKDLGDFSDGLW